MPSSPAWSLVLALLAGACASSDQVRDQDEPTLDITVVVGDNVLRDDRAQFQAARYTLFPDGSLHGQVGGGLTVRDRPARVRVLAPSQLAPIWKGWDEWMAKQPAAPTAAAGMTTPWITGVEPTMGCVTIIVWMEHDGRSVWSVTTMDELARDTPNELASMVRTLAAACWMDDTPASRDLPMRYDFGPDPYATMRGNAALIPAATPAAPTHSAPPSGAPANGVLAPKPATP